MSIHSEVDYKCKLCDCRYVPMPGYENCPGCGSEPAEVYDDFVLRALWSAQYNLYFNGGSFRAPVWGTFTTGDHYYWIAFEFLSYMAKILKVAESSLIPRELAGNEIDDLVEGFIGEMDFSEQRHMESAMRGYTTLIAQATKEKHFDEERVSQLFKQALERRRGRRYS